MRFISRPSEKSNQKNKFFSIDTKKLHEEKRIPFIPVSIDSPLTVKLTDVFKLHPECYDSETLNLLQRNNAPFEFPGLEYVTSVEDSKKISLSNIPAIIISASGMCEGGRVLHHLAATIENSKNAVIIVGFQAEVCVLYGFSGHADQNGLVKFVQSVALKGHLEKIILIHGEPKAQEVLKRKILELNDLSIEIPKPKDKIKLKLGIFVI